MCSSVDKELTQDVGIGTLYPVQPTYLCLALCPSIPLYAYPYVRLAQCMSSPIRRFLILIHMYHILRVSLHEGILLSLLLYLYSITQTILVTELQYMSPKATYLPKSIPKEFADRVFAFHEKPFVWFAGQFLSYLMRPNEEVMKFISNRKKNLGITKPYVG